MRYLDPSGNSLSAAEWAKQYRDPSAILAKAETDGFLAVLTWVELAVEWELPPKAFLLQTFAVKRVGKDARREELLTEWYANKHQAEDRFIEEAKKKGIPIGAY